MTAHEEINARYRFQGARFRRLLREVGLMDLRQAAEFLSISTRQAQRIAAGTHVASIAAGKLLCLMRYHKTLPSEFD